MHLLELFSDPYCPCRTSKVALIKNITGHFPGLEFRELNALENMHRLNDLGIKMFPFLLLDGELIKVGILREKELKGILNSRLSEKV